MAKQAITLKIAGKSYPFTIESGKEEMYRLAEREVNNYLALIKQQKRIPLIWLLCWLPRKRIL